MRNSLFYINFVIIFRKIAICCIKMVLTSILTMFNLTINFTYFAAISNTLRLLSRITGTKHSFVKITRQIYFATSFNCIVRSFNWLINGWRKFSSKLWNNKKANIAARFEANTDVLFVKVWSVSVRRSVGSYNPDFIVSYIKLFYKKKK